jgi:hypothetical protein
LILDQMQIPYRLTSGAALAALALPIVSAFLPGSTPRLRPVPLQDGSIGWDPCFLWVQLHPMAKLVALVWLAAYVMFTLWGIRNRSGPRWFAVAGVLALSLWIESDWWRIAAGCYSSRSLTILFLWAGVVNLMFLHHLVQRHCGDLVAAHPLSPTGSEDGRQLRAANAVVLRVLVFTPIAWSGLNALRTFHREPSLTERAIGVAQHCVSWAALALFLCAAILTSCVLWSSHVTRSGALR